MNPAIAFVVDDGGRAAAGFKGETGDCVTRAITIATGLDYAAVYTDLWQLDRDMRGAKAKGPRNGVPRKVYERYLEGVGWTWVPTMVVGSGCQVHLRADELPGGPLVVRLTRHMAAVIDGVLHDTFDGSRDGTRCVYGYFTPLERNS